MAKRIRISNHVDVHVNEKETFSDFGYETFGCSALVAPPLGARMESDSPAKS
ncbi:uncharacterized protein PHALS_06625 [Plasmopara halstedii]|uniref:Uncharacterized protein n=1 Tax=Plasmopara halstedii TaxID=4781 RepID=A0A0P1B2X4_PLAHL|nr:uncharacterized protein PHALS_06625 [Plasmopara halstedii]CEG48825.1 hypothetical protein PHALS_06625 [Plasmopara halstedii]|eukprot:XP_024585194.1 hypothetical protein PHALS_06625 [Plasmopara halstedii]